MCFNLSGMVQAPDTAAEVWREVARGRREVVALTTELSIVRRNLKLDRNYKNYTSTVSSEEKHVRCGKLYVTLSLGSF